jgi:hypothetical protein
LHFKVWFDGIHVRLVAILEQLDFSAVGLWEGHTAVEILIFFIFQPSLLKSPSSNPLKQGNKRSDNLCFHHPVLVISLSNTTKDRPTAYGDKTRAVSTVSNVAQGQVNDETMQSKNSSIWKRIAGKLGINIPIVLLMIKYVL